MQTKNMSIKNKYQYIGFSSNSVRFKENDLWGINDLEGNEVLPKYYNEIFTLSSGYKFFAAREGYFWKIYNKNGVEIFSEKYDSLHPYYGLFGITKIKKGDKFGLINKYGRKIIPPIFKKIEKFGSGLVFHNFDSTTEFLDRKSLINLPEISKEMHIDYLKNPVKNILQSKAIKKSKSF